MNTIDDGDDEMVLAMVVCACIMSAATTVFAGSRITMHTWYVYRRLYSSSQAGLFQRQRRRRWPFQVQIPYGPHIIQRVGSAANAIPGAQYAFLAGVCCRSGVAPVLIFEYIDYTCTENM